MKLNYGGDIGRFARAGSGNRQQQGNKQEPNKEERTSIDGVCHQLLYRMIQVPNSLAGADLVCDVGTSTLFSISGSGSSRRYISGQNSPVLGHGHSTAWHARTRIITRNRNKETDLLDDGGAHCSHPWLVARHHGGNNTSILDGRPRYPRKVACPSHH